MKKIIGIALVSGLIAVSCAKKTESTESNVMLAEPDVKMIDSPAVTKPADNATATPKTETQTGAGAATEHAMGNTNAANSTGESGGTPNGTPTPGSPAANTATKK